MTKGISIALLGNPNCGKTSLFNQLTGGSQRIGNWPGVTLEKKSGILKKHEQIEIVDLPGIYSLAPYSPEELVTRNYLLTEPPSVVINLVDGTNLERHLYLTLQLLEIGLPLVLGVNMMDVVEKNKQVLHLSLLGDFLNVPVVGVSVTKQQQLNELVAQARKVGQSQRRPQVVSYDPRLETALAEISTVIRDTVAAERLRWASIKLFERDEQLTQALKLTQTQMAEINDIIEITEKIFKNDSTALMIDERYRVITRLIQQVVVKEHHFQASFSDRIDRIVTDRVLALPIFAFVMWAVYYLSIQTVGTMGTDWINEQLFGEYVPQFVEHYLTRWGVYPWLSGLILDGIIAGVGAVLGFLPQLVVLFLCLAILEDCGYMARIAFVMDRLFRKFGLSGKSFIPMLIATGCGVPGVMACRTIENEKERRLTIMTTTFMPCSAKLPIIGLVAGAFFPNSSWLAPSAYFVGVMAIICSGIWLKKTRLFAGETTPFIMELPAYHVPNLTNVLRQTYDRAKAFVTGAGTIILATAVLLWFASNYNFQAQPVAADDSVLAAFGNGIAWLFQPLGWGNWRAVVATVTGLMAKENIVGSFGVLYNHVDSISETGQEVWGALRHSMPPLAGYSFLIFNLLCAPCFAAVGAIKREMGALKWTLLAVGYQCGLAYLVSFVVYQLGSWLTTANYSTVGVVVASLTVGLMLYGLLRQKPQDKTINAQDIQLLN